MACLDLESNESLQISIRDDKRGFAWNLFDENWPLFQRSWRHARGFLTEQEKKKKQKKSRDYHEPGSTRSRPIRHSEHVLYSPLSSLLMFYSSLPYSNESNRVYITMRVTRRSREILILFANSGKVSNASHLKNQIFENFSYSFF